MADTGPRHRESAPAGPHIEHQPGLADQTLRELAPLLADEGIDVDNLDAAAPATLQQALNRAVERQNMALFTPVGTARALAAATLRQTIEALDQHHHTAAAARLEQAVPDSPDDSTATVAGCIGLALDLLDDWLSGHNPNAPASLAAHARPPAGHWHGQRAATDILALASKARAFRSLDTLITRQGGQRVLYGSALALTAAIQSWAELTDTPVPDLTPQVR